MLRIWSPLGLNWIRLGLQDVLYDPATKQIYTPNTNQTAVMGTRALQTPPEDDTMGLEDPDGGEYRANPYHDPKNGRFTSGGGKKVKAVKSSSKTKLGKKEFERVSSAILTDHPNYKAGERYTKYFGKNRYVFTVKGPGEYSFISKSRIKGRK